MRGKLGLVLKGVILLLAAYGLFTFVSCSNRGVCPFTGKDLPGKNVHVENSISSQELAKKTCSLSCEKPCCKEKAAK